MSKYYKKKINDLVQTLKFYADRTNYNDYSLNISIPNNKVKTSSIEDDRGRQARLILLKYNQGPKNET